MDESRTESRRSSRPPSENVVGIRRDVPLGKIFGIDVTIDVSWLFIFVLVMGSLLSEFSRWHRAWGPAVSLGTAFVAAVLFFASVLVHELAHSIVARAQGLRVKNIMLFMFGGVSNLEEEPRSARTEFVTAIVGPLTSLALGVLLSLLGSLLAGMAPGISLRPDSFLMRGGPITALCLWLGSVNFILGLFNLVPGFPLDGGRVLRAVLWSGTRDLHRATRIAAGVGVGVGWLFILIGGAMAFGFKAPFFGTGVASGLWLVAIGWFLRGAAAQSHRADMLTERVEGLTVADVMSPAPPAVLATASLEMLFRSWIAVTEARVFPVLHDEQFVGLVTQEALGNVQRDAWRTTSVAEVMVPIGRLTIVRPDEPVQSALLKFPQAETGAMPVMWGTRLLGILQPADIARRILQTNRPWVEQRSFAQPRVPDEA